MLVAHHLASRVLPRYTCKCSRHDFTLPQLFACLCCKELLGRTYRGAEALLRDAEHWCRAIGMTKVPDHNTLCNAAARLLKRRNVGGLLDQVARWAEQARALGLSVKPLAGDSTHFETRHVSRHYERRCAKARQNLRKRAMKRCRTRTVKRLPKLGVGVTCASHLILSTWVGTGAGSDSPHFERLLFDAWRRVPHRRFTAVFDAGYDAEHNHDLARREMGLRSIIPPRIGRPTEKPPPARSWRGRMWRLLRSRRSRRACGYTQRWQAETVVSMIKRNLGDELRGKTAVSRKREMLLKVLVHDIMIIRRQREGRDRAFATPFRHSDT
jgi:DDE family transposase